MKITFKILLAITISLNLFSYLRAGTSSDTHPVNITISAIDEIAIAGGNLTLTINSATAGTGPDDKTDNTTNDLDWTSNGTNIKITGATNLVTQKFTLKVLAKNVTGGTAAAIATITNTAKDVVTGITKTTGGCDLEYTAQATAAQGAGSDVHTITYTMTAG